jgi:acetyl-CoA synthetase
MSETSFVWKANAQTLEKTTLSAFLKVQGLADYAQLLHKANKNPGWFWDALFQFFNIHFEKPYKDILKTPRGPQWPIWCDQGKTNLITHCLERHRETPTWQYPAIVWENEQGQSRELTYQEVDAQTTQLAAGLLSLGIRSGDVIGLYMPMIPEVAIAYFAIAKIGAIVMPLFSGYGPKPLVDRLADSQAVAVITVDQTYRRGKKIPMKSVIDEAALSLDSLKHIITLQREKNTPVTHQPRDCDWDSLIHTTRPPVATALMPADAPIMLMYTSGTTGKAKGTIHTHCGVIGKNLLDVGLCLDLKPTERLMWLSDMGWAAGPKIIVSCALLGATLVIAEGAPDYPEPNRQWQLIEKHKVTLLGTVPTAVRQMMRHSSDLPHQYDLSSLRATVSAGEPWNEDAWMWFFNHVCQKRIPILNYGGGTECGGAILIGTFHHPLKPCAFGAPVPGTGADIVDPDGAPLPDGQMGELVMRTPSIGLTRGLWKDPERYEHSYWQQIPNVWVQGDLARRDADGLWYLLGRSDDTIKLSGKRTGPAEIESALVQSTLVAEAAVVGLPDAVTGSSLSCVCVPHNLEEANEHLKLLIQSHLAKELGASYRPKQIFFVSQLPKTRNEKIMRRMVRAVLTLSPLGDTSALVNPESIDELRLTFTQSQTKGVQL